MSTTADTEVCDRVDLQWMYMSEEEDDCYSNSPIILSQRGSPVEKIRKVLLRNSKIRLGSTVFDIIVKIGACVLYFIRLQLDSVVKYGCYGNPCKDNSTYEVFPNDTNADDEMKFSSAKIIWPLLLWVHRPTALWLIEVILSMVALTKALLFIFISKLRKIELMTKPAFILEAMCSIPLIITVFYPDKLKNLFVPTFLNCWLAKMAMEQLFNDLHLTKQRFQTISVTLSQQLMILAATLLCLIITTVCGIQHIQRASTEKSLTTFEAFYFVIVTFSTVGYGDISPDIWLGQVFTILMICIAIAYIPHQVEGIASLWIEKRKKGGGEYSRRQAKLNRHVVVCATNLGGDAIMDFLTEFYSSTTHVQVYNVILLCSDELNSSILMLLQDPKWSNRVIYMRGSVLNETDLKRCRMHEADACFILAPWHHINKNQEDQHTIMRSWAVKDFCPNCIQFIQLFRTESKKHVKFAEHVVCEDEFRFALLANNCLYPGLSTLVSLLVHTSTGYEGELATEPWMQLYGQHSGNEVYHIQVMKSLFFQQYEGCTFTSASADAHNRYGVSLVGILDTEKDDHKIILNPGPSYTLKGSDFCFYMNTTKEEITRIKLDQKLPQKKRTHREQHYGKIASDLQKCLDKTETEELYSIDGEDMFNTITSEGGFKYANIIQSTVPQKEAPDLLHRTSSDCGNNLPEPQNLMLMYNEVASEGFITGAPPTFLPGYKKTICHLVRNRRQLCCLRWGEDCNHVKYKNANDAHRQNNLIILTAEKISVGIYNFIVPLRSKSISVKSLSPIVLMLEEEPPPVYLDVLVHFPMVYWMKGSTNNVDDLLRAGINEASHLVIVNRSSNLEPGVVQLTDSETVVAVQSIVRWFPNAYILTEISQTSNIKFMQFQPNDEYSQKIARLEKKLKEHLRYSLAHIFRLPFASGQVFSCSMLDTLLYQTFSKRYLIKFVRLLLGIDAEENSGHLSSIKVKQDIFTKYKTYGELYKGLCEVTGEVPIAIYRTEARKQDNLKRNNEDCPLPKSIRSDVKLSHSSLSGQQFYERDDQNLLNFVKYRMASLGIEDNGEEDETPDNSLSYVISNPQPSCRLKKGDIVYVIQPSAMFAVPSRIEHRKLSNRRKSWTEGISPILDSTPAPCIVAHNSFTNTLPAVDMLGLSGTSGRADVDPLIREDKEMMMPLDSLDLAYPKILKSDRDIPL